MNKNKLFVLFCILLTLTSVVISCLPDKIKSNDNESSLAVSDTVITDTAQVNADTAMVPETVTIDGKTYKNVTLIIDTSKVWLSRFPNEEWWNERVLWREVKYADLDKDGVDELLTAYFTGGHHCCYIYNFYRQTSPNTYESIIEFKGGENSVEIKGNKLEFSFFEQIGYFYTCYACSVESELPFEFYAPYFSMVYENNKMKYAEYDEKLNSKIIKNLEFLKARKPSEFNELGFDDGTRKSYAGLIIAYYFNKGQDLKLTKKIFDKYYNGDDGKEVWNAIKHHILGIFDTNYSTSVFLNQTVPDVKKYLDKRKKE